MAGFRHTFDQKQKGYLVKYLATHTPDGRNRRGNKIYEELVAQLASDPERRAWASQHSWAAWREQYVKKQPEYDHAINRYLKTHPTSSHGAPSPVRKPSETNAAGKRSRTQFTQADDRELAIYLAQKTVGPEGRAGNALYETLVENAEGKWPWSCRHTMYSWRERYIKKRALYDEFIIELQREATRASQSSASQKNPSSQSTNNRKPRSEAQTAHEHRRSKSKQQQIKEEEKEEEEEEEDDEGEQEEQPENAELSDQPESSEQRGSRIQAPSRKRTRGATDTTRATPERDVKRRRIENQDTRPQRGVTSTATGEQLDQHEGVNEESDTETAADNVKTSQLPPSDDYEGGIYEEEDGSELGEDQVAAEMLGAANSNTRGEASTEAQAPGDEHNPDGEEGDEREHTPQPQGLSSPGTIPVATQNDTTPAARIYPDVPSSLPSSFMQQSLPGAFPDTSTPNGAQPRARLDVSPSKPPRSDMQRQTKAALKISQGPTPPTSVAAQSPADSPAPAVQREEEYYSDEAPATNLHTVSTRAVRGTQSETSRIVESRSHSASTHVKNAPNAQAGPSSVAPSQLRRLRKKVRDLPIEEDGDFFASVPPTPTPPLPAEDLDTERSPAKRPPRLDEGAFNSAFTDIYGRPRIGFSGSRRRATGIDDDGETSNVGLDESPRSSWPPNRMRSKGKGKAKEQVTPVRPVRNAKPAVQQYRAAQAASSAQRSRAPPSTSVIVSAAPPAGVPRVHHAFSQRTQTLDQHLPRILFRPAIAIVEHHDFSQPFGTQLNMAAQLLASEPKAEPLSQVVPRTPARKALTAKQKAFLSNILERQAQQEEANEPRPSSPTPEPELSDDVQPEEPKLPVQSPQATALRRTASLAETALVHSPRRVPAQRRADAPFIFPASGEVKLFDPSIIAGHVARQAQMHEEGPSYPPSEVINRRATIAVPAVRDAHLHRVAARPSLPLPAPAVHSRYSEVHDHEPRRIGLSSRPSAADTSLAIPPGMPMNLEDAQRLKDFAIKELSKHYGFTVEVVNNLFGAMQSLAGVERLLGKMKAGAEKLALEEIEALEAAAEHQAEPEAPEGQLARRPRKSRTVVSHSRNVSTFVIEPLGASDAEAEMTAVYSPPRHTRAGRYKRLSRAGLLDEPLSFSGDAYPPMLEDGHDSNDQVDEMLGDDTMADADADPEEAPEEEEKEEEVRGALTRARLQKLAAEKGPLFVKSMMGRLLGNVIAKHE